MSFRAVALSLSAMVLPLPCSAAMLDIADWNMANHPNNADDQSQLRTILGYAGRIDLLTMSETDTASAPDTASVFGSVYGGTYASVVAPADGGGDRTGFVYNTAKMTLIGTSTVGSGTLTHPTLRAQFRPAGTTGGDDLYVYAVHLISGDTTANKNTRVSQAQLLRNDVATLGTANAIVAGDFNWHAADEVSAGVGAYRTFAAAGTGQVVDPLNRVGKWQNNAPYQDLFSEDPDTNLNDRFDMQLASPSLLNGSGLDYLPGSYHVVGNLGNVAPGGVIASSGSLTSDVVTALGQFSDHLPVLAGYHFDPSTLAGDADLDGGVSIADFNRLAANFGRPSGQGWATGDFDDDGGVSIADFNLLAANFGRTLASSGSTAAALSLWDFAVARHDEAAFIAATGVPEPGVMLLALLPVLAIQRRRLRGQVGAPPGVGCSR